MVMAKSRTGLVFCRLVLVLLTTTIHFHFHLLEGNDWGGLVQLGTHLELVKVWPDKKEQVTGFLTEVGLQAGTNWGSL